MTYTARLGVFAFMGASNSAWQILGGGQPVRFTRRSRETSLIFKHEAAARAAVIALNDGATLAAAYEIGRKADTEAFRQTEVAAAAKYLPA